MKSNQQTGVKTGNTLHVKEDTYWEKQRHMNICYDKQLFLYNFIHNTGIKLIYNGEPQP